MRHTPYLIHCSYFSVKHNAPTLTPPVMRPRRTIHLPFKYNDFVDSGTLVNQLVHLQDNELHVLIDDHTPFLAAIHAIATSEALLCSIRDDNASDPATVSEACRSTYWTEWLSAMHEELASLKAKGVYEEIPSLPPSRKAVQCKWVLHIKCDKAGEISHFKAHLVAKGFTQIPGQDFTFTFAPVARWDSIRSLLCLAAINDFDICQLDVKTAYLNGPLDEEIYMCVPEGSLSHLLIGDCAKVFTASAKLAVSGI